MNAVSRGIEVDKRFLTDILPASEYEQYVFLNDGYYAIEIIKKDHIVMKSWDKFFETLKDRFGSKLKEVYSITSDGIHFIIYIDYV